MCRGFQKCRVRKAKRLEGMYQQAKCGELETVQGDWRPTVGRGAWQDAGAGKKL